MHAVKEWIRSNNTVIPNLFCPMYPHSTPLSYIFNKSNGFMVFLAKFVFGLLGVGRNWLFQPFTLLLHLVVFSFNSAVLIHLQLTQVGVKQRHVLCTLP